MNRVNNLVAHSLQKGYFTKGSKEYDLLNMRSMPAWSHLKLLYIYSIFERLKGELQQFFNPIIGFQWVMPF